MRKAAPTFKIGESVMALCGLDNCWHKAVVRGMSEVSISVYFDDFAYDQPETLFDNVEAMTEKMGSSGNSSGNILMNSTNSMLAMNTLDDSTALGMTLEEELNKMVIEIDREAGESRGVGFAKVTRDYQALQDDELSVKRGVLIDVLEIVDAKWARCVTLANDDDQGKVLKSCIKML